MRPWQKAALVRQHAAEKAACEEERDEPEDEGAGALKRSVVLRVREAMGRQACALQ